MTKALTRQQWEALWSEIDPVAVGGCMGFAEYSRLVDEVKSRWLREIPAMSCASASNRRYVAHLEDALERGLEVSADMLRSVKPEDDLRYDRSAFPLLNSALGGL